MKTKLGLNKAQKSTHQSLTKPFGKKFMSLVLCICMLIGVLATMPINVSAETSGKCGDNLTWTLDDEGALTISGTGNMRNWSYPEDASWYSDRENIKTVIIQNGVTSIGSYAFYNCSNLTSITILDSVTSIGWHAFYNCSNLISINIPDSVMSIGSYAFYLCSGLTSINVNENNKNYRSDEGILFNKNMTTLIQYPSAKANSEYVIPNSVTSISNSAFRGCTGLTSITIPNSVTSIGSYAFYLCSGLTSINVNENNKNYRSDEGILFNKNMTTLIQYPSAKANSEYVIPNSVTSISDSAFRGCTDLTSVTIPNSVTSISDSAFIGCSGLTNITIPNSITKVHGWAFYNCKNLSDVWYDGTEEEKEKINIQEKNENLLNATWHYNSTIPVNIPNYEKGGDVIAAIYNSDDMLISINTYIPAEFINVSYGKGGAYMKVMQWETGTMKPLAPEKRIDL